MDTVFSKVLDLRGRFHVHVYPVQILASWDIGHPTCPVTVQLNLSLLYNQRRRKSEALLFQAVCRRQSY